MAGYQRDTQMYLLTAKHKFVSSLWGEERDKETFPSSTKMPWETKEL